MGNVTTELAYINPAVLTWAINRSGLSRPSISKKIGVSSDQLTAWEKKGGSRPPFSKAQELAQVLQVPFGYLFLSTPPATEIDVPDFRKLSPSYQTSPELRRLIRDVLVRQDWYRAHVEDTRGTHPAFVGSFNLSSDPLVVASDIREKLKMGASQRHSVGGWAEYLTLLTHKAEDLGLLVMRTGVVGHDAKLKISENEFQGLALADKIAPVIVINASDTRAAQNFTFAHELTHIWIGQSGIGNPKDGDVADAHNVERFCNTVATEVLCPKLPFINEWRQARGRQQVERVATEFWVSSLVVLRRAHELGEITTAEFYQKRSEAISKQRRQKKTARVDYYRSATVRLGYRLTSTLLQEVNAGSVGLREAALLASMKVGTLRKFAAKEKH